MPMERNSLQQIDICLCEPFILPGILPTLGTATLSSAVQLENASTRIFYPSLTFFVQNRIADHPVLLRAIADIPLQVCEFLFGDGTEETFRFVFERLHLQGDADGQRCIRKFYQQAQTIVDQLSQNIAACQPKIFLYSLTFGDYNFAFSLIRALRRRMPNLKIVVGASSCTPQTAPLYFRLAPQIDYLICDEGVDTTRRIVRHLLYGADSLDGCAFFATKKKPATATRHLQDLNEIPCPDYTDFMRVVTKLGMDPALVMVPYEMSRGCWWGAKKSCAMCGYFGNQKSYILKDPQRVVADIAYLKQKYAIQRIRFTDLVAPLRSYAEKLLPLEHSGVDFYLEFRPNMREEDVALWRRIGVCFSQIGIESLSTGELAAIHKGTTAINNIYVLKLLFTYKIQTDWNYLYGFPFDRQEWYMEGISRMSWLHHLAPPSARQVWLNRNSRLFESVDQDALVPICPASHGQNDFLPLETFYLSSGVDWLEPTYQELQHEIARWQVAFRQGSALVLDSATPDQITLRRTQAGHTEYIHLQKLQAQLYLFLFEPRKRQKILEAFSDQKPETIDDALDCMCRQKITICADETWLALAVKKTDYRWKILKLF